MNLTAIDGGIVRLRTKGGASPRSLYDLLNGYVTAARTVQVRPGTIRTASLPAGTKGLTAFDGELHVFSSSVIVVPTGFVSHVLTHPEYFDGIASPGDYALAQIHFAEPFLGFLYVVAEFVNGDVYHFWLQSGGPWEANKIYRNGDIVEPTTPNGLAYQATRLSAPLPSWAANVPRADGDMIEPTTYNDYFYTVVDTVGANPASGATEPTWPEADGARVFEDTEGVLADGRGTTTPPTTPTPTTDIRDRYERGDR